MTHFLSSNCYISEMKQGEVWLGQFCNDCHSGCDLQLAATAKLQTIYVDCCVSGR